MTPSIIFDFDGTLATGLGPVLAYARLLAPDAGDGFVEAVDAELRTYEEGRSSYRDGYDIAGSLATVRGVGADARQLAYLRSRELLGTDAAPVGTMPGLAGLLDRLAAHARLVLATNAPERGIDRVLDRWEVRGSFHALHFSVGKPDGLIPIVAEALAGGPVLAVGDIAEFDLEPAADLGAQTALVGTASTSSLATVTMRAPSLADLAPDIESWAAKAASVPPASHPANASIER